MNFKPEPTSPEPLSLKENVLALCALVARYREVTALVEAPLCFGNFCSAPGCQSYIGTSPAVLAILTSDTIKCPQK